MKPLTRKQREIREREELILRVAQTILNREGYLGMTMAKIADAIEYSKGTIYQHFSSKEDIVVALALDVSEIRNRLFERASVFRGHSRERMTGLGVAYELFIRLRPDHFESCQIAHNPEILAKAAPERQGALLSAEGRCMGLAVGIVRDALAQGDLTLPAYLTPEQLSFGLWAEHFGCYRMLAAGAPLSRLGINDPYRTVFCVCQALLDGVAWRPGSSECDYMASAQRILHEVFPAEAKQAGLA